MASVIETWVWGLQHGCTVDVIFLINGGVGIDSRVCFQR